MIKCKICENHQRTGAKHTCSKCETKIIYGVMQEPFIECCQFFSMTEIEKRRRAYFKKINSLPIDDRGHGGKRNEVLFYTGRKARGNKKKHGIKNKTFQRAKRGTATDKQIIVITGRNFANKTQKKRLFLLKK